VSRHVASGARATGHAPGRRLSLRWKLVLSGLALEAVVAGTLVAASLGATESTFLMQAEGRARDVAANLETVLASESSASSGEAIARALAAARRGDGIAYLALGDSRQQLLGVAGWPADRPLPVPAAMPAHAAAEHRIDARVPLRLAAGASGELRIGFSDTALIDAQHRLLWQGLGLAGGGLLISAVVLAAFGRRLARRLDALQTVAQALAQGDSPPRLAVDGGDEIAVLTRSFNDMADGVAAEIEALREREAGFRKMADLASDWYWEQDAEFRFTRFTGGSFRNYPEFAKAAIGKCRWESPFIRLSPEEMAAHRADLEAHRPFRDFEYLATDASGTVRWLSINGEPVFDAAGEFTGYRGTGRDITARKQAEAAMHDSEQKFASLFQFSPLPLSLIDLKTARIADVNDAWVRLLGYSLEGKTANALAVSDLFQYDNERRAFEGLAERHGRCYGIEAHLLARDGRSLVCELSGRTLSIGEHDYFLWGVHDISQQRLIEEQIRDLNARLELRVAERTRELQQAMENLRLAQDELVNSEKLAALGSVVAGVAHELNTPIGNSVMVASTLDEKAHEFAALIASGQVRRSAVDEFVRGCVDGADMLVRNLQQAHNLIFSFKQVAVDQTSERRRDFDLRTMVEQVMATLGPMLHKTAFRLVIDVPSGIIMNSYPGPLGQVLTNFVNNALLHAFDGREEGAMHLVARRLETAEFVELVFSDDGHGIDAEHLKRIFDPFFTTRMGRGGSGLGLNIVYNLVTRILGGSIDVASEPGGGTQFRLYLPILAPAVAGTEDA